MSNRLSPRDYETLSAYLDGELSPREKTRLEARLIKQPELKTGLEELRRTSLTLRSLPILRAPRNFTLKPSMIQARTRPRAYPIFQLASALASILLVIVFAGDLALSFSSQNFAPKMASPASSSAPAAAPAQPAGGQAPFAPPVPFVTAAPAQPLLAPEIAGSTPASAPTQEPNPGQPAAANPAVTCDGTCEPQPTQTPEPSFSIAGVPTNPSTAASGLGAGESSPSPDATLAQNTGPAQDTSIPDQAPPLTAAPLPFATSPDQTSQPAPLLQQNPDAADSTPEDAAGPQMKMAPNTGASTESNPTEEPGQVIGRANSSPQQDQSQSPIRPVLHLLEAILAGIAAIGGIGLLVLRITNHQ